MKGNPGVRGAPGAEDVEAEDDWTDSKAGDFTTPEIFVEKLEVDDCGTVGIGGGGAGARFTSSKMREVVRSPVIGLMILGAGAGGNSGVMG